MWQFENAFGAAFTFKLKYAAFTRMKKIVSELRRKHFQISTFSN
jgi:hypothetical protein